MGFYDNTIIPLVYDWLMDRPFLRAERTRQLADVAGEILEIGAGTGLNLPHYPSRVARITTVDPNPGMNRRLRTRAAGARMEVVQHRLSGEQLPFAEASFDYVVSTLTLCSISDLPQALNEVYRVLRPGGTFVFLEHGLSPDARIQKWQRRLNFLQRRLAGGCRLDLDIRGQISSRAFTAVEIDNFTLEHVPRTHGYMYRGWARK